MPEMSAPMIGTKAPRNTRTPIANVSGTPSNHAANAMPIASIRATTTVARTKAVSERHAVWPDECARSRAARGKRATTQLQMRSPS
jgi:hypothetical protein